MGQGSGTVPLWDGDGTGAGYRLTPSHATKKAPLLARRRLQRGSWDTVPGALSQLPYASETCAYSRSEPFFSGRKNMAMNATT